jgi:hypothetical protein
MGIDKKIIQQVTEDAKSRGYDVRIRDISYAILKTVLDDELIAYTVVFGQPDRDSDTTDYESLDNVKYLLRYFDKKLHSKKQEKDDSEDILKVLTAQTGKVESKSDISFEENKAQYLALIDRIEAGITDGEIELDKGLKLIGDIRIKITSTFDTKADSQKSVYILPPNYDMVCPHTHRECYQMTKEYAMKQFNLKEE